MSNQSGKVAELLTDDSFLRWINGDASSLEQKKWDRWLQEDPANQAILEQAKELNRSLRFKEETPDTAAQLKSLETVLNTKKRYKKKVDPKNNSTAHWVRAAAIIILLASVLAVIRYIGLEPVSKPTKKAATTVKTIQTDYGEVKQLSFSDGSRIILNAHSSLAYPQKQRGGNMEVQLEGEAYFDIVHKTGSNTRTFSVQTPDGKVVVLGTEFNVNTHTGSTEVVLEKGEVQVQKVDTSSSGSFHYTMQPGELVRLSAGGENFEVNSVDTKLYTSWKNFELKFKNTPLSQIASRVEEIYGIKVVFKSFALKKVEFSGSTPNKNLAVLVEGLRTLLDVPITHSENKIIIGAP